MTSDPESLVIDIQDNGIGLPDQPQRLFEPYVTHRARGTGLGLPIVKKIIEEHDGTLDLRPAPAFAEGGRPWRLGADRPANRRCRAGHGTTAASGRR
jgi:two-component system, NtrC family, nitrogen regulation sensor histidine kinase NtrY